FKFEKWIVVNIASATLRYYESDSIKLRMKVVVGKPSTRTPRFAAHCNQVVFYPYWNVPASIALNELLPEFKRNPGDVDALNMQVLDLKGNIIDYHKLNWKNYSKAYFPFRIRQSTGCDNSLGVVKFNLTSPFSVYLHDTNNKTAFLSGLRYYSHGCIRIEEPIELANYLLPGKVDSKFLEACLKDQKPVMLDLPEPVPVFVIYQTVEVNLKNQMKYYKDIYRLLR
ncbi:MAG: L,D-transpeptidase family protein, partial [Ginsengibacter sp.]